MALAALVQDTATHWKPPRWRRDADSGTPVLTEEPLIQNLNLKSTKAAEQFCLCGRYPCPSHRVSANGVSFRGSYTIAAGTWFIETISWHFI